MRRVPRLSAKTPLSPTPDFRACGQPLRRLADPGQPERMNLKPYEFRSPAELIDDIASRVPLTDGTAYLVLVAQPSTSQQVISIELLDVPSELDDDEEACNEMRERIEGWPLARCVAAGALSRRGRRTTGVVRDGSQRRRVVQCLALHQPSPGAVQRRPHLGHRARLGRLRMTRFGEVTPALRPA